MNELNVGGLRIAVLFQIERYAGCYVVLGIALETVIIEGDKATFRNAVRKFNAGLRLAAARGNPV